MKKSDSKGFMLAETLIVSSFIAIILIYLFVQFRNINSNYSKTLKYNSVNELYILGQIKEYISPFLEELSLKISYEENNYQLLNNCDESIFGDSINYCEKLFNMSNIKTAIFLDSGQIDSYSAFSTEFNDYLKTIKKETGLYLLAAEFNDNSFASIKLNGYNFPSLENVIKSDLKYTIGQTGSGVYYDPTDADNHIYVYKGNATELNNNIEILGHKGKIIFLDNQGVKVYLDLKENLAFDSANKYFTSSSLLINGSYPSNSTNNSSLFANLNSNLEATDFILSNALYGVGNLSSVTGRALTSILADENKAIYQISNISNYAVTLNVSDIIRTSSNSGCNLNSVSNSCLLNNWLVSSNNVWTMNSSSSGVWSIYGNAFTNTSVSNTTLRNAYQVVYLSKELSVMGDGTSAHPYRIK